MATSSAARSIDSLSGITVSGGTLDVCAALTGWATWADFSYVGAEDGTYHQPYNTVDESVGGTPSGGQLMIKPGTSNWTGMIDQSVMIRAYEGTVLIGQ